VRDETTGIFFPPRREFRWQRPRGSVPHPPRPLVTRASTAPGARTDRRDDRAGDLHGGKLRPVLHGMLSLIRGRRAAERSGTTMANALRHVLAGPGPFARARSFGIDAAEARHARYARLARWRRAAPASAPALASLDGARGYHRGRDAHAAPRREIMSNALSVPRDATEEEEDSDDALLRAEGGAAPILKRFNGDKMSLHQSPANGSTNARRAAAQGTRARRPPLAEFPRTRQKKNRSPARLPRFFMQGRVRDLFFLSFPRSRRPRPPCPSPPPPPPPRRPSTSVILRSTHPAPTRSRFRREHSR